MFTHACWSCTERLIASRACFVAVHACFPSFLLLLSLISSCTLIICDLIVICRFVLPASWRACTYALLCSSLFLSLNHHLWQGKRHPHSHSSSHQHTHAHSSGNTLRYTQLIMLSTDYSFSMFRSFVHTHVHARPFSSSILLHSHSHTHSHHAYLYHHWSRLDALYRSMPPSFSISSPFSRYTSFFTLKWPFLTLLPYNDACECNRNFNDGTNDTPEIKG